MVAENRKLLVLNEFFSAMDPVDRFDANPVSGKEFARRQFCSDKTSEFAA